MYMPGANAAANEAAQQQMMNLTSGIKQEEQHDQQQFNGGGPTTGSDGEAKKKKKKKPFDPYRPKKQLSKVWTAFRDSPEGAYCNHCGTLRKRNDSSTKSLWEHLKQKHPELLKELKGEGNTSNVSNTSNANISTSSANDITDIQNMCSTILNTSYEPSPLNFMASLNAGPTHQLFGSFNLAQAQNGGAVSSANDDGTANVFGLLASSSGMRQISQPFVISLVRWRLTPGWQKDRMAISFTVRGLRADNGAHAHSEYVSDEVVNVNPSEPSILQTSTGKTIRLLGPIETDNKQLVEHFRNGFPPNWKQLIIQHVGQMFK